MNARTLRWAVPAAAAVLLLAGCGQTEAAGAGSAKLTVPKYSTEICNAPDYVRQGAPAGVCGDEFHAQVEDDLSLGYLHQERMQRVQR